MLWHRKGRYSCPLIDDRSGISLLSHINTSSKDSFHAGPVKHRSLELVASKTLRNTQSSYRTSLSCKCHIPPRCILRLRYFFGPATLSLSELGLRA